MPTIEYKTGLNVIEYNSENEIILTKQDAGLSLNNLDKLKEELNLNLHIKNFDIHNTHGLSFTKKLKLMWRLWKFVQ